MATIKKACKGVSYPKSSSVSKRLGSPSKAKSGGSFPDLNKDGKITKKDVLIGRGVLPKTAKKGKMVKKAQNGITSSNVPIKKGSSGPGITGVRKAVFNQAKSDWGEKPNTQWSQDQMSKWKSDINKKPNYKKGGSVKKIMKTGGKMKKCAYGCK